MTDQTKAADLGTEEQKTGGAPILSDTNNEGGVSATSSETNIETGDENNLQALKAKNKYIRNAFTKASNLLRTQMEHNISTAVTDKTYGKLSDLNDQLANITKSLLTLPSSSIPSGTLAELLKVADQYDSSYNDISNLYITYTTAYSPAKRNVSFSFAPPTLTQKQHENVHQYGNSEEVDEDEDNHRQHPGPVVKFQPLRLPKFSGGTDNPDQLMGFGDWISLFSLSVEGISPKALKQAYLLQSLEKPAVELIQNIPCSDIGFDASLKILNQNYGNVRKNIQVSIKKVIEYSPKQIDRRVHLSINYRKTGRSFYNYIGLFKTRIKLKFLQNLS